MAGRSLAPFPRPSAWRRYAAPAFCGVMALTAFALAGSMVFFRAQAEPVVAVLVPWIFRRNRHPYGPEDYAGYVALVAGMGLLWLAVGAWSLRAIPTAERRLDARLAGQLEAETERNTRTLG